MHRSPQGQMKPLIDRLGEYRMGKRAIRIEDRSDSRKLAIMGMGRANAALTVTHGRSFWGRLKWMLFGK